MNFYGVGLDFEMTKILKQCRTQIANSKNVLTIYSFRQAFLKMNSAFVGLEDFDQILRKQTFFLTKVQLQAIFKFLDPERTGVISFELFIGALREELTPRRVAIIKKIVNKLDPEGTGKILKKRVLDQLYTDCLPQVRRGIQSKEAATNEILECLKLQEENSTCAYDRFFTFFEEIGLEYGSEQQFADNICDIWQVKELEAKDISSEKLASMLTAIRNYVKQRMSKIPEIKYPFNLKMVYNDFAFKQESVNNMKFEKMRYDYVYLAGKRVDEIDKRVLSEEELGISLRKENIILTKPYLRAVFQKIDQNQTGFIEFPEFKAFIES